MERMLGARRLRDWLVAFGLAMALLCLPRVAWACEGAVTVCGETIKTCSPQHRQNAALTFGPSQRTIVSSVSKVISTVCFMLQPFNDREDEGRLRLRYCFALERSGDFRSIVLRSR